MPPFRLSTSKSLSPIQRPHIATARNVSLAKVPLLPYPEPEAVKLLPRDEAQSYGVRLQSDHILDLLPIGLEPQDSLTFKASLPEPDPPAEKLRPIGRYPISGKRYSPYQRYQIVGPAPLHKPGHPAHGPEGSLSSSAPVMADLLRPLLEPSVLSSELGQLVLPKPLHDHQREAVKELFKRDALLLADEPGMGKTVTVCVALSALIQRGLARRCLVVCPGTSLRHWSAHLQTWAPFLLFSVVRGGRVQRTLAWRSKAHICLTDYASLAMDVEAGILAGGDLQFDIVTLDGIHTIGFYSREISGALGRLEARRRWALTGAVPGDIEDWLRIFSFLTPEKAKMSARDTLPDYRRQFLPYVLRREKAEVATHLPSQIRQLIWLDLDERQSEYYQQALAEERERLSAFGGAATKTHIAAAVDRLKRLCNFAPELLDSSKVRALVDLIEEIAAAEAKVIVFSQFHEEGLDRLQPILEAYGALRLNVDTPIKRRDQVLEAYRQDKLWHVLLVEMGARTDGLPLTQATYIVHFDHSWNPAIRQRAERRMHPLLGPSTPVNIYEFWAADTIDERLHTLLASRRLLPSQVPEDTQPAELEQRMTVEDWLYEVLEISTKKVPAELSVPHTERRVWPSGEALQHPDLLQLSLSDLMVEAETLMHLMGYMETEARGELQDLYGDIMASRYGQRGIDRVLVRCICAEKSVGVQQGRRLLEDMQAREDCKAAYLVVTTDFTASCRKLAWESEGKLVLVSGSDLRRRLQSPGGM